MSKASILLFLSLILFEVVQNTYTTLDGSQFIPLSYSPNVQYEPREIVSQDNINQEMLSYYSWFSSYGYCQDVDIPLMLQKLFRFFQ